MITVYAVIGNPLFVEYIFSRTFKSSAYCPLSARYFGVSGKNNKHIPISTAGKEHMSMNKFHERNEKYSVRYSNVMGITTQAITV